MIDSERIFNAITSEKFPALAVEEGSELVDKWIEECYAEDLRYKTLMLEAGFFIELEANTFITGAADKVMVDPEYGPIGEEMKSTSRRSKYWTPERWLEQISSTHQVATYAAAFREGSFIVGGGELWRPQITEPRLLCRAISKTKPPELWPTPAGALVAIDSRHINATLNAYRSAAVAIRARRKLGVVPWQIPGFHCVKRYPGNKEFPCEFGTECGERTYPTERRSEDRGMSPGSTSVLKYLVDSGRVEVDNPEVTVLSASSLDDFMQCAEKWRRRSIGQERESKESLEIGSVLHLGLKEYHTILKENGF